MDKRRFEWNVYLTAQVFNVYFNGIWQNVGVVIPHVANNNFFTKGSALVSQEILKKRKFFAGKLDIFSCTGNFVGNGIKREVACGKNIGLLFGWSA